MRNIENQQFSREEEIVRKFISLFTFRLCHFLLKKIWLTLLCKMNYLIGNLAGVEWRIKLTRKKNIPLLYINRWELNRINFFYSSEAIFQRPIDTVFPFASIVGTGRECRKGSESKELEESRCTSDRRSFDDNENRCWFSHEN